MFHSTRFTTDSAVRPRNVVNNQKCSKTRNLVTFGQFVDTLLVEKITTFLVKNFTTNYRQTTNAVHGIAPMCCMYVIWV